MSEFQNSIEEIIKNHIEYLTSSRNPRKNSHIGNQYSLLLKELYDQEKNGIIFVNHFGHIEYMNSSFSRFFMLDRYDKPFNNILNIGQLPLDIEIRNHRFYMTYPNGHLMSFNMSYQLVDFQKNMLLQFRFEDTTELLTLRNTLNRTESKFDYYMEHVSSPMFIIDGDGMINDVASDNKLLFGIELEKLLHQSIFEHLPFDYANEVIDRLKKVTDKLNCHFLYEYRKDKVVSVYDTTIYKYINNQFLCHIKDVSDLNTMSSTIEYLNTFDSLTGFYNRAYFEENAVKYNDTVNMPLGVYVLTMQGLRKTNNLFGYHISDNLLIELAMDIKKTLSQHEIPCRISGDTFVILLPNTSEESLNKFLKIMDGQLGKYREKYSELPITYNHKHLFLRSKTKDYLPLIKGLIT